MNNDNGREVFVRAKEDRKFMTMYFNDITSSKHFLSVLKNGIRPNGNSWQQEFEQEIFETWNNYLVEAGRAEPAEVAIADKTSFIRKVFGFLEEDDSIDFRIIDHKKNIGAVKLGEVFYQVGVVKHKKPAVNELEVGTKLNDFVQTLSEKLSEEYSLIRIKNNAITIDNNGEQTSVTIVKKKVKLF